MKKIFTCISAALLAISMQAAAPKPVDTLQVDGLYFQLRDNQTAVVIPDTSATTHYDIENIVIPVAVQKNEVSYPVVALARAAFRWCPAKSITFAEGSQVTELGMQCFQRDTNLTELVIPEGIKMIPLTCIHSDQDPAVEPMRLTKLVLPASLDTLPQMSIVAKSLQSIEFKGAVPPGCCHKYVSATDYYQIPWEINKTSKSFTPKECMIIVPDGALAAYQAAPGIGDYFTTIIEKKDAPTAIENVSTKTFKQGVYTITGHYMGEDATNLPAGMYIINGKKVIR